MTTFTITPDGLKLLEKKLIQRLTVTGIALLMISAFVIFWASGVEINSTTPIVAVTAVAFTAFSMFNTFRKQKKMLHSFKLTITGETIMREMEGVPTITMNKTQITQVVKSAPNVLAIIADSKINAIVVPAEVNNMETLEQMLNEVKPIIVKTSTDWLQIYQWIIVLPVIGLIYRAFISENLVISSLGGLAMVACMIYGFFVIQKSKNVESRLKRLSYIAWVPILSVLAMTLMRLFK